MDEAKQYGIVELMGHKVVAGEISKSEMLGKPMLRVDIPVTSAFPAFTQFYGDASIYCVTFTSKEVATSTAESCKVNPVCVYSPELITLEQHRDAIKQLQDRLLNQRSLPDTSDDDEPDSNDDESIIF